MTRTVLLPICIAFISIWTSCNKEKIESPDDNMNIEEKSIIPESSDSTLYNGPAPEYAKINVFNRDLLYPGYKHFRSPAVITTNNGTLITFSQMRTGGDLDPKTIVYRRSTDNGESWSDIEFLEEQTLTKVYGNQIFVADRETGTIHAIYLEVFPTNSGPNNCNMYHRTSTDDGLTWSDREFIPNVVEAPWRPPGPGTAIQLERGENKGRILIPGRYNGGNYSIYSDDNGETWELGYKSKINGHVGAENETTCVELAGTEGSESKIYINSRNQENSNNYYRRLETYSYDSGESIIHPFSRNNHFKTTRIQASLFRWSAIDQGDSRNRILFSAVTLGNENLSGSILKKRRHVGIWSTFNETETWTVPKRISDLYSGYSSITKTEDGSIGVLFEEGEQRYFDNATLVKINEAFLDVPLIGGKWTFEEVGPMEEVSEGEELEETYNGGTSRNITATGNIETTNGSLEFNQNTALKFDGESYLKLNDLDTWTQFDFNENSSFTVEMVIKVEDSKGAGFLLGRPYQSMWPQWLLRMENDGKLSFRIDDDKSFSFVESKESLTDGKWHHIAAVRDRDTQKLKIYIDGELSNEVFDEVEGSLANRKPLYVGGTDDGEGNLVGAIDFVRITPDVIENFFE